MEMTIEQREERAQTLKDEIIEYLVPNPESVEWSQDPNNRKGLVRYDLILLEPNERPILQINFDPTTIRVRVLNTFPEYLSEGLVKIEGSANFPYREHSDNQNIIAWINDYLKRNK